MNEYEYIGEVRLKNGSLLANGFVRIVHGERGDYVEFHPDQICLSELIIPDAQRWRLRSSVAYYIEYRTKCGNVKVYYQRCRVDYANYIIGMYYVSPTYLKDFVVRRER